MTINLNEFFPASAKDVKKLLGAIQIDTQQEDHIGLLLNHLNDRITTDLEGGQKKKQMLRNINQLKKAK